jgi:hypothetical protein
MAQQIWGSRLLVASYQGRGEYDLESGARVARDRDEDSSTWFDPLALRVWRCPRRSWVLVAGLAGGALPAASGRWRIEVKGEDAVVVADEGWAQQLCAGEEVRVVWFSPDGDAIVVGRPMDVAIFRQ